MKIGFNFSLLTFLLLWVSHAHSQRITKVGHNKFTYKSGEYKFQDMGDVFVADHDSYKKFQSAKGLRILTKSYGIMTLTAMSVGTLALIIDGGNTRPRESFCCTGGQVVGLASWIIIVPLAGTIGLISRLAYNRKKNKSIKLFNNSQDIGYISNPEQWNLRIGGGQYGYGIVINF